MKSFNAIFKIFEALILITFYNNSIFFFVIDDISIKNIPYDAQ